MSPHEAFLSSVFSKRPRNQQQDPQLQAGACAIWSPLQFPLPQQGFSPTYNLPTFPESGSQSAGTLWTLFCDCQSPTRLSTWINTGLSQAEDRPSDSCPPIPQGSRSGSEFGYWLWSLPLAFPVSYCGLSYGTSDSEAHSDLGPLHQTLPDPPGQAPPPSPGSSTKLEAERCEGPAGEQSWLPLASTQNQSLKDATSNYTRVQCALKPFVVNGSQ